MLTQPDRPLARLDIADRLRPYRGYTGRAQGDRAAQGRVIAAMGLGPVRHPQVHVETHRTARRWTRWSCFIHERAGLGCDACRAGPHRRRCRRSIPVPRTLDRDMLSGVPPVCRARPAFNGRARLKCKHGRGSGNAARLRIFVDVAEQRVGVLKERRRPRRVRSVRHPAQKSRDEGQASARALQLPVRQPVTA